MLAIEVYRGMVILTRRETEGKAVLWWIGSNEVVMNCGYGENGREHIQTKMEGAQGVTVIRRVTLSRIFSGRASINKKEGLTLFSMKANANASR